MYCRYECHSHEEKRVVETKSFLEAKLKLDFIGTILWLNQTA